MVTLILFTWWPWNKSSRNRSVFEKILSGGNAYSTFMQVLFHVHWMFCILWK
jgi:uncharacterized metal-binding protein